MHWKLAFFSFTLPLGTLVALCLGYLGWYRRRETGAKAFIVLMLAIAVWSFAYVMEQFTPGLTGKVFWHNVSYIGIPLVPLAWFTLNVQIQDTEHRFRPVYVIIVSMIPLLMTVLTLTLPADNFIWGIHTINVFDNIEYLELNRKQGFEYFTIYSYALLTVGMVLYLRLLLRARSLRIGQIGALYTAVTLPLLLNILHIVFEIEPFFPLDLTPVALATTGVSAGWFIFRFDLQDILPAARTAIVESMRDGVIVLNMANRVVSANAAAQRILGQHETHLAGRLIDELLPDGGTWVLQTLTTATQPTSQQQHLEITVPRMSQYEGTTEVLSADRYVDLSVSALHDARRRASGYLVILRDITERKRTREALLRTQHMESIGLLAGGVAHDFNNLLTSIMTRHTLALAQLDAQTPAYEQIRKAALSTERAADLTRQLLAYAGKGRFQVEAVDLNQIIHENGALLETAVPKNVELRLCMTPDLPTVKADRGQIHQIVMNLVLNAVEAIGMAQGEIEIHTGLCHLDGVSARQLLWKEEPRPGDYAFIEVRDTGVGIPPPLVDRIFDPFFTTKPTGRGLGLSALQGIIHGHGGAVRVQSEVGLGTTFCVVFPIPANTDQLLSQPESAAHSILAAEGQLYATVLVVDDEQSILDALLDILQDVGLHVLTASNGRQGIECFANHHASIDLVLLDLQMPVMSGAETFHALRAIDPNVRVLLSSGYSQSELSSSLDGKIQTAFIQKPYEPRKLVAKMRLMLQS